MKGSIRSSSAAVLFAAAAAATPPEIIDLAQNVNTDGLCRGLSDDGRFALGAEDPRLWNHHAFRWWFEAGSLQRSELSPVDNSVAVASSADGSVIAGVLGADACFRWSAAEGLRLCQLLPNSTLGYPAKVSSDGAVIFGRCRIGGRGDVACRWAPDGSVLEIPVPATGGPFTINDMSLDGRCFVGAGGPAGSTVALLWHADGRVTPLPVPPNSRAAASLVNADGSVIVGTIDGGWVRWVGDAAGANPEVEVLPTVPGGRGIVPQCLNSTGGALGGYAYGVPGTNAVLWSRRTGMAYLRDVLIDLGADPSPWRLQEVRAISRDGTVIAANAESVATGRIRPVLIRGLPALALCPADLNDDGHLDFFDLDHFITAFDAGTPDADYSRDGFIDFFDYADFVADFEHGC